MGSWSADLNAALFLILLVLLPVAYYYERRRKARLIGYYRDLGFKPVERQQLESMIGTDRFGLFGGSWHNRRSTELYVGTWKDIDIAQFTLSVGEGSHAGKHQTVSFIRGEKDLPRFLLRPESFTDRVVDRFKQVDIDFDTHPGFSESYVLQGEDERAVRDFFGTALLTYFEEHSGYSIESVGRDLVIFRDYHRAGSADDIKIQLEVAISIYRTLVAQ